MNAAPLLLKKVAIVTGSSRGIGAAIAQRLAADGASVVVNYASSAPAARDVVAAIQKAGGRALAVRGDVSAAADVGALFDAAEKAFGQVDILVNNAGIMINRPIRDVEESEFDKVIALNLKGTFLGCREAARRMKEDGRIINMSSTTTAGMFPNYGSYVASKGGVEQLTRVLAKELGPQRITVNAVSPGPTDTELFNEGKSPELMQRLASLAALNRIGTPEEIAEVVAFLASPAARWVTGQNVRVNGGLA